MTDPESRSGEGVPWIISVDDHVLEPADVWTSRLPKRGSEQGPRLVRDRVTPIGVKRAKKDLLKGGAYVRGEGDDWCDWWLYEDFEIPIAHGMVEAGFADESEEHRRRGTADWRVVTFDEIHPGCWKQPDRLAAMDFNHVEASICFPNILPRFCGQTFAESQDKELALLCVQAYNDWIVDEWCAGDGRGRLIPMTIVPLWSAELAAAEIRRCAAKGSHAVSFSENPAALGLPSVHDRDRYWDPFFAACEDTDTIVNLHIGSSSVLPKTAPDSPVAVTSALNWQNCCSSLMDYIFSGTLERFPGLRVAYSEGQVGWMPFVLERADKLFEHRGRVTEMGYDRITRRPSEYVPGRVYGCIFDDEVGLLLRDEIGMSQITFEVDYPHGDSTYPETVAILTRLCDRAGLDDDERYALVRGNAIAAYGLPRFGITEQITGTEVAVNAFADDGHDLSDLAPRLEPRAELAVLARALHREGYADFPAGHITIRQPDDTFLHNPWGLDWDELRASDVIRIDKNANVVEGRGRVNPAILLHLELHQARGDVGVALHNHPRYATLWAIKKAVPPAYEQQGCYLRDDEIAVMDTYAGTVDKSDAARDNVEAVHGANIALLANHGVLVAGVDAAEAYTRAVVLENRCRVAYLVEAGGGGFLMPDAGKEALQESARRHKDVVGGFWWAHAIRRELRLDPGVLA